MRIVFAAELLNPVVTSANTVMFPSVIDSMASSHNSHPLFSRWKSFNLGSKPLLKWPIAANKAGWPQPSSRRTNTKDRALISCSFFSFDTSTQPNQPLCRSNQSNGRNPVRALSPLAQSDKIRCIGTLKVRWNLNVMKYEPSADDQIQSQSTDHATGPLELKS